MKLLFPLQEAKSPVEKEKCVLCLVSKAGRALCVLSVNTDKLGHQEAGGVSSCSTYSGHRSAMISFVKPTEPKQRRMRAMNTSTLLSTGVSQVIRVFMHFELQETFIFWIPSS